MGTIIELTMSGVDEVSAARAARSVFDEFKRIDALMTSWSNDGVVAEINTRGSTQAVKVNDELAKVIKQTLRISRQSGGAFDITVGAFRGLWKFDEDRDGTLPSDQAVAERLPLVGFRNVRLDLQKNTVRLLRPKMRITLGGAAKGYAVDRAVALLRQRGIKNFILQAGGDLYVSGRKPDRPWVVGIRDPRGQPDAPFAIAEIANKTFSTSGDYERHVIANGVRYHHILDPKTGRPANGCRSVTVQARNALTADLWSTALFVMGPTKALKLVESRRDLEAVIVDANNQVLISSGLKGKVKIQRPPTAGI